MVGVDVRLPIRPAPIELVCFCSLQTYVGTVLIVADGSIGDQRADEADPTQSGHFFATRRSPLGDGRGRAMGGVGGCFSGSGHLAHVGRDLLPIVSGGRYFIIAAMTIEVSIDWDADIQWISSSTDNGALAVKRSAACEGRGEIGGPWAKTLGPADRSSIGLGGCAAYAASAQWST